MKELLSFSILIVIISSIQLAVAVPNENDFGNVKAWFNGQEATVKNVELRVGEPIHIKAIVNSNISGNVYVKLTNPLVTEPYQVISGPSAIEQTISNSKVTEGWSKTYTWTITPNGAWTNGNAPINFFVEFSKKGVDKKIEFTIANPYILDEQYTGAAAITEAPEITGTGALENAAPFPSIMFAFTALFLAWRRGRDPRP